jgi:hypothetical protein
MLFAYLTLDEVNQNLAERLAADAGVGLEVLSFRDAAPAGQFDAVLYDLDFLPDDRRQQLLADLSAGRRVEPVAVHGYCLTGRQARALRRRGVLVARKLRPELFARLRTVAGRAAETVGEVAARPQVAGQ